MILRDLFSGRLVIVLLMSIISTLACSSAWANVVNYSAAYDFYPGIIPVGQTGIIQFAGTAISSQTNAQTGVNGIFGLLAPDTEITFTFTFPTSGIERITMSTGYYNISGSGLTSDYVGISDGSTTIANEGTTVCCGWVNGASLTFATANISPDLTTGTSSSYNYSAGVGHYSTWVTQLQSLPFATPVSIGYSVTAITAVPLPPAILTFISALCIFLIRNKLYRNGSRDYPGQHNSLYQA